MPFNDYDPDPTVPNVGQLLRESGYETTWIGKWHVSDTYVDTPDGIPGFVNVALPAGLPDIRMGDVTDFIHATDAVQYLEQHASLSPQPWLCFVSLQNPHDICFFDDLADKPYLNAEYLPPLPANFGVNPDEPDSLQGRRLHQPRLRGPADLPFWRPMTRDWTEIQWRAYAQTYYQMTQSVDRAIGMVLDALEAGGWADDTLVVMTADHGEGLGSHRWYTKGALYEESVCVPLIVRPPKRDRLAPRVEGALVSGLDLAPTLLDYAGLGPPPLSRGRSLRALIETQRGLVRECIPAELVLYGDNDEHIGRMIRSERFKYNAYLVGERREELYDLAEDPGETTNLARRPEFRAELERHRAVLRDWLAVVGDAFPVPEE